MFGYSLVMDVLTQPLAFVDIETTGGNFRYSRVTEVGVIVVHDGVVRRKYRQLVDPETPIPTNITRITGIKDEDVRNQPTFQDIAEELNVLLEGCIFIAHHVRFDYSFLRHEFKAAGIDFKPKQLCTVRLSRALYPLETGHGLDKIISRFNLPVASRHRAFDDAQVLWHFFNIILKSFDQKTIETAIKAQFRRQAMPSRLDPQLIDSLPSAPGVYIFEGEESAPLYIGKSIDIKHRVMVHFSDDHRRYTELKISQQLKNIRYIRTHGELGALIKESDMVKEVMPLHNRKLRRTSEMCVISESRNGAGYFEATVERRTRIEPAQISEILGVYRSTRSANETLIELSRNFSLCNKLLGLERGSGECFDWQLKRCNGACAGHEDPVRYNIRFAEAFAHAKLAAWPFRGPISIRECHPDMDGSTSYIFDRWCYLAEIEEEDFGFNVLEHSRVFDKDMYHILRAFISKPANQKKITVLEGTSLVSSCFSKSRTDR